MTEADELIAETLAEYEAGSRDLRKDDATRRGYLFACELLRIIARRLAREPVAWEAKLYSSSKVHLCWTITEAQSLGHNEDVLEFCRPLYRSALVASPVAEAVAWLDMRNEPATDWTTRVVATNPEFVTNNGPENFAPLYASPVAHAVSDAEVRPDRTVLYANALAALTALDDWTNVNETEFTGWGDGDVPPGATFWRVKTGQALKALEEVRKIGVREAAQRART